ncbi:8660_t:CDS:1, partial [Ambispora leptoticha]
EIAEREKQFYYTYDDAIKIQPSQFANMQIADRHLVMQQLIGDMNNNNLDHEKREIARQRYWANIAVETARFDKKQQIEQRR